MADAPDRDQQTEAPTTKRRADAARDGDVLISRELATALVVMAGTAWLALAGQWLVEGSAALLRSGLSFDGGIVEDFQPVERLLALVAGVAMPLAALFGLTLLAAIAGPAMLGSLGWRNKAMAFKGNKLNPLAGLKRMFGLQGGIELAKALAKTAVLGAIGWWMIAAELPLILSLAATDPASAAAQLGASLIKMLFALSLGITLIALIDVPTQWFQRYRRLRMTKQQLKDESRESDGAPELKAAQRARQQAILSQSARKAMGEATVVLTNPTHFAIALRYRPGKDGAPVVVARGRDEVAQAMKALASERAVPMLEYPQLTRGLYFTTRAGQAIPEDLYRAVAVILAFVFRLDREMAAYPKPPVVEVPEDKRFGADGKLEAKP
jgi:flagellar biosynthesis protein FlhB